MSLEKTLIAEKKRYKKAAGLEKENNNEVIDPVQVSKQVEQDIKAAPRIDK